MTSIAIFLMIPIFLIIILFAFYRNYSIDRGFHRKAKVINAIVIGISFINFASVIPYLIETGLYFFVSGNLPEIFTQVGFNLFPRISIFNTLLSLLSFFCLIFMVLRNDFARKVFICHLPLVFIGESIFSYLIYKKVMPHIGERVAMMNGFLNLIFFLIVTLIIILIYSSGFMRRFYQYDNSLEKGSFEELEKSIDQIGELND